MTYVGVSNVPIATTCTNLAMQTFIVPAGSPPGLLVATAKINVRINHTQNVVADRGFVTFGNSIGDCGSSDAQRSFFRVPGAAATASTYNPVTGAGEYYEFTIVVQVPFTPIAGTNTLFLNGQMLSGVPNLGIPPVLTPNDYMGDATITIEFHQL